MKKYTQEDINNLIKIRDNRRYLEHLNFHSCDLSGLDLSDIVFMHVNLVNANLSNANLSNANLYYVNLFDANLSGDNLSGTTLYNTNLYYADLNNANLSNIKLHHCIGNCEEIKSMQMYKYNFTEDEISIMYKGALNCSEKHKE